jgi:two-component system, OmpR family, sensor histidine kinase MprB
MSLRTRLALASAAGLAVAIALASVVVYVVVQSQLRSQVDDALKERAATVEAAQGVGAPGFPGRVPPPFLGGAGGIFQVATAGGEILGVSQANIALPVSDRVRDVATGDSGPFFEDAHVKGTHVRVLTVPITLPSGAAGALEIARPLTEVDNVLHRLRLILLFVALGGVALAGGVGFLIAQAVLGPVRRLTVATETIAETRDLGERVDAAGTDELARLGRSFNTMLAALEDSLRAQRQLVADASHELRTPLTSLRTNVEVLARGGLPPEERRRALADAQAQIEELSALVADVVELARDGEAPPVLEDVRLDLLVRDELRRQERRGLPVTFDARLDEVVVRGDADRLHRAVANILDNAVTWSPENGVVEVEVSRGAMTVRDHGPGIAPEDLPYVFDRFYRAPSARGKPGSGLGLAIVRRVAELHGGSVRAETAEDGGTRIRLELSTTS